LELLDHPILANSTIAGRKFDRKASGMHFGPFVAALFSGHNSGLDDVHETNSERVGCMEPNWLANIVFFLLVMITMAGVANAQLIVAHRGSSHDAPENTLAAFNLAWKQNADGIEGDFWLSRDGQVVCCHDHTTGRTAGVDLEIARSTLDELKKLDVGHWKSDSFAGERIPTLQEVIATVPDGKLFVIELKDGPAIVPPLKKILEESALNRNQVLVISFNQNVIRESKLAMPDIRAHWLSGYEQDSKTGRWEPTPDEVVNVVRETGADGFGSKGKADLFDAGFIRSIKERDVREFHVWTIDDPKDARMYRDLGAVGITTNRPDLIRHELEKETANKEKRPARDK